ncbi:cysteine protease ATG4D-like [Palaemon carinicauda]|uniref:cysteine protease ATG4D-like n=1 Tax=Palaemon carinicauda TaxID=392227 RepID=UPI0035B68219
MIPRKLPLSSRQENSHQYTTSRANQRYEPIGGIAEAQECTETSGWSHSSCICKKSHCSDCKYGLEQSNNIENEPDDYVRVALTRTASLDYQPSQFYVRAAGGMSIPVPAPKMSYENNQHHINPSPPVQTIPQLDDGSLDLTQYTRDGSSTNSEKKTSSYLPLSVELVAGRGNTSMPADGNKSSSAGGKVKSIPPSRTLALSASLFKNYLIPGNDKSQSKTTAPTPETENSVKTKMLGIWNNVKYGWTVNLKTNFSRDSPVYLLASVYHKSFGENDDVASEEIEENGMEAFKRHFYSLIWCTYRRQFPTLHDSTLTTDCGWGCMLRSGQMMVAHALTLHFLSSRWRHIKNINDGLEEKIHQRIVEWLGDSPSPQCPLSLHNLVHFGNKLGKKAGDWYGPASVAYIFKEAIEMGSKYIHDLQRVCVYVAQDCAVYIQDVLDLTTTPCLCSRGDLIKWSEISNVKRKTTSDYLEKIKISAVPNTSDPSGQLENGSGGLDHRGSEVTGRPYRKSTDVTEGNVNRNYSKKSFHSESSNKDSQSLTNAGQTNEYCDKFKTVTETLDNVGGTGASANQPGQCSKCENWRSVIIMVPVRLGGESLNPIYASCVCSLFTHELCIGIIGGRPKHSLYFVGFQEEHLIHLDPHLCQDAVSLSQPIIPVSTYHCSSPRKMSLSRMDPSATLGFYCHTRTDFLRLMEELPELLTPKEPGYEYPIFEFIDGRSEDADALARQLTTEDAMAAAFPRDMPLLPQDSEEFVFI